MSKVRAHLIISGKVQGVYFRQNMKQVAKKHNVTGWVMNLKNGDVEAVIEGEEKDVNEVIEWCHVGPSNARVEDVKVKFEEYKGEFDSFEIRY